jgi:hypothetical protein
VLFFRLADERFIDFCHCNSLCFFKSFKVQCDLLGSVSVFQDAFTTKPSVASWECCRSVLFFSHPHAD